MRPRALTLLGLLVTALTLSSADVPTAAAVRPPGSSAGAPAATHVMGRHRRHAGGRQQSLNWAGYIRQGSGFAQVSATWTEPTLRTTYDGYSSTWVGIDGATSTDQYLIQTGTEADVSGGRRSYRAWWEIITPEDVAPETLFSTLAIHPGDSISASVTRLASGRWRMGVRDNTTGHSASHTAAFAGPGRSAEWIQEDTDVNGSISTAPDWGAVTFRRCRLDTDSPDLRPTEAIDLVDRAGTREVATGSPTSSGSGFTVTWLATGTRTPAG